MSQTSRSASGRRGWLRVVLRTHPRSGDAAFGKPRWGFSLQPKVAESARLPWVAVKWADNPERVAAFRRDTQGRRRGAPPILS